MHAIHQVARAMPEVPVIGCGGVRSGDDAVEMLLAGAWAVQVGTAAIVDPAAPVEVAAGVGDYLKTKGLTSPADLRGRLREPGGAA
jgi:dihydroorotate dehydrogenase (NAD+) catalytic subunit